MNNSGLAELRGPDMSEIEDGKMNKRCVECDKRQVVLRKMHDGLKTKNFIAVCVNRECWRFHNVMETPSWVREDSFIL